ncbi:hypothetical protein [uncultured Bacteroides sp.]|uniref:hypothetical protein n=1 Tax=uncultured Bacteroides sp. TaxID=162156 RepID=UPI0025D487E4|nr:hypothetical protein [uncultured Bacteroides sp.]
MQALRQSDAGVSADRCQCLSRQTLLFIARNTTVYREGRYRLSRETLLPIATGVNAYRQRSPMAAFSAAFPDRLVCKHFAIGLYVCKITVSRFVFSRQPHLGTETNDSKALENTDCQNVGTGGSNAPLPQRGRAAANSFHAVLRREDAVLRREDAVHQRDVRFASETCSPP